MPEYESYKGMKKRCYNKNSKDYYNYGSRGIKIADEWLGHTGFPTFLEDMGLRPTNKHSIDRIDSNGDYCKENCKWSTVTEQSINHRRNWLVYIDNQWVDAVTASRILNVPYSSLVNGMRGVQKLPKTCLDIKFERRGQIKQDY